MTCELRTERREAAGHAEVWGHSVAGRGNDLCGPESGRSLKRVRSVKASVPGGRGARSEVGESRGRVLGWLSVGEPRDLVCPPAAA